MPYESKALLDSLSDAPLLLYDIAYDGCGLTWAPAADTIDALAAQWTGEQQALLLRAAMVHTKRTALGAGPAAAAACVLATYGGHDGHVATDVTRHVPLLERPTLESVEAVAASREGREARKRGAAAQDVLGDDDAE